MSEGNSAKWEHSNSKTRSFAIKNLLGLVEATHENLTAEHISAITLAKTVSESLLEKYRVTSGRPTRAFAFAHLCTLSDIANQAKEVGAEIVTFDTIDLNHVTLQAEIVGRAIALYKSGILTAPELNIAIDHADNNWDILMNDEPWLCLESMAVSILNFPQKKQKENLEHFQQMSPEDVRRYLTSNYDIETQFAAQTHLYLLSLRKQYNLNQSNDTAVSQLKRHFDHQNQIVLAARQNNSKSIKFEQKESAPAFSRLQAYAWLTAMQLYIQRK